MASDLSVIHVLPGPEPIPPGPDPLPSPDPEPPWPAPPLPDPAPEPEPDGPDTPPSWRSLGIQSDVVVELDGPVAFVTGVVEAASERARIVGEIASLDGITRVESSLRPPAA